EQRAETFRQLERRRVRYANDAPATGDNRESTALPGRLIGAKETDRGGTAPGMAGQPSEGRIELDRERRADERVCDRQVDPAERVVHRLVALVDLLAAGIVDGHRQVGQLIPELRGHLQIDLHLLGPA